MSSYRVEDRAGLRILVHDNHSGCAPASAAECEFWDELAELRKDRERLREALAKIRNDDTQQQKPYHFWSIAVAALDSDAD